MKERIFLCALGMIILVASSLPMGIGTVPMPAETGDWVIQSGETVTVTDRDITLTGNLTIYGTLTFENVTLRMNLSKDGDYAILVKAGGKFYVYNSTITSVNISNSFGFYVFNNATLEMKYSLLSYCGFPPGAVGLNFYPMGLHIESNDVLLVNNTISKGYYGIYIISSNPKIEGNVIEKSLYGIYATDSTPTIKDNFISNDRGIFLSKSNAIITRNEITQAYSGSGIGILLSLCNPEVKFNKISSGYIGIYMQGSSPNVIGNIIEKNWQAGITISGDNSGGQPGGGSTSKPVIENNTIRYNGYAIQSYGSEPKIISNNIHENREGISMREGGGEIINNTIEKSKSQNYGYGIYSSNSNLLIEKNKIRNNAFSGIFIAKMLPKLLNNDITNNKYGLAFADGFFSLVNHTINGNKDADVYLIDYLPDHKASKPATVDLVNVTFSSAKVGDSNSILKVYWYVDIYVYFESNSEPASGADVKIYEKNSDTPYYKGTTDGSGLVKLIRVMEYSMNATGKNEKTPHNITAEADGKVNWTVSEIRKNSVFHIPLDNVPPLLKIISPKDGYLTNRSEVEIKGETEPGAYIDIIGFECIADNNGYFSITVPLESEGENVITVEARDWNKNLATATVTVIRDTIQPELNVIEPKDGIYTNKKYIDVVGSTEKDVKIKVNSKEIEVFALKFNTTLELKDEGENIIVIEAEDLAGNKKLVQRKVILDTIPPSLVVWEPRNGTIVNENEFIMVIGTVEIGADVKVNGFLVQTFEGSFRHEIKLTEGNNPIIVEAMDKAKNMEKVEINVIYDITPPILQIEEPKDGFITNEKSINVIGITEENAKVYINGEEVQFVGTEFVHLVELSEGNNMIEVEAKDLAGNKKYVKLSVILDTKEPMLKIEPLPKSTNKTEIEVEGETEANAHVFVNDELVENFDGKFSTIVPLVEGESKIYIKARDIANNTKKLELKIIRDTTPPFLEIIEPKENRTKINEISVRGRTEKDAKVYVNGTEVNVNKDGEFSSSVKLVDGENKINIRAIDPLGNEKTFDLCVIKVRSSGRQGSESPTIILPLILLIAFISSVLAISFYIYKKKKAQAEHFQYQRNQLPPAYSQPPTKELNGGGSLSISEINEKLDELRAKIVLGSQTYANEHAQESKPEMLMVEARVPDQYLEETKTEENRKTEKCYSCREWIEEDWEYCPYCTSRLR